MKDTLPLANLHKEQTLAKETNINTNSHEYKEEETPASSQPIKDIASCSVSSCDLELNSDFINSDEKLDADLLQMDFADLDHLDLLNLTLQDINDTTDSTEIIGLTEQKSSSSIFPEHYGMDFYFNETPDLVPGISSRNQSLTPLDVDCAEQKEDAFWREDTLDTVLGLPATPMSGGHMIPSNEAQHDQIPQDIRAGCPLPILPPTHHVQNVPDFGSMPMPRLLDLGLTLQELMDFNLVCRFAEDRHGNHYLLHILESLHPEQRVHAVDSLIRHLLSVQVDWAAVCECFNGHKLVQKLFTFGDHAHWDLLLRHFVNFNALRLSQTTFGSRFLQFLVPLLDARQVHVFLACLERQWTKGRQDGQRGRGVDLLCTVSSAYLLQRVLGLQLPFGEVAFIANAIENDLVRASSDVNGCRVVQCFIQNYGEKLDVMRLCANGQHLRLATNRYGNYVVQCIIQRDAWYSEQPQMAKFRDRLIADMFTLRQLQTLCVRKAGSHVIESCIRVATAGQRDVMIKAVQRNRAQLLGIMLVDQFGNYVLRTLLGHCDRIQREAVVHVVHSQVVDLYTGKMKGDQAVHEMYDEVLAQCRKIKQEMDEQNGHRAPCPPRIRHQRKRRAIRYRRRR